MSANDATLRCTGQEKDIQTKKSERQISTNQRNFHTLTGNGGAEKEGEEGQEREEKGQEKKERREGEEKRRNRTAINTRDLLTRQWGTLNGIMQLSPQQTDQHITNPH